MKKKGYWVGIGLCVLLIAALLLVFRVLNMDMEQFAGKYKNSFAAGPVVVFLYLLKAATVFFLPQPVVYLMTGLLFSPLYAFLITVGGLCLEFSMDYAVGRRFGKKWVDKLVGKLQGRSRTLDRILAAGSLDNLQVIAMLRLLPGVSTDSVSLLAGSRGVQFRRFFFGSLLGCAPQAVAVTLMGSAAHDPLSPQFLIPVAALAVVLVGSFLLKKRFDRRRAEEQPEG